MKTLLIGVAMFLSLIGDANAKYHPHNIQPSVPGVSWFSSSQHSYPVGSSPKHIRTHHHYSKRIRNKREVRVLTKTTGGLVTVPTAAGIPITVASNLVQQFQGFIKDIVNAGYTPKHIGCWAPVGTHVPNSNHYHGGACDFDQTGWNRTAPKMYHVSDIARRWGLRDGCTFSRPDCGHIDDGRNIGWYFPHNLIAKYVDKLQQPAVKPALVPFEE